MFYYIRHFLLSEKLYAIFLWHGKNDRTFSPEKSNATGVLFSRRSYSFFYRFGIFVQA